MVQERPPRRVWFAARSQNNDAGNWRGSRGRPARPLPNRWVSVVSVPVRFE